MMMMLMIDDKDDDELIDDDDADDTRRLAVCSSMRLRGMTILDTWVRWVRLKSFWW